MSRTVHLILLLLALLFASLPAAVAAQDGRRIAPARGQQARLVLTEVLRLGSAFGGDDEFGRLIDVKLGRSGRVYVTDDLKHQLSVFDSTGRLLHRTGRKGRGPGEFQAPWHVAVDTRDSVFVWDWQLDRVSVFAPDLRYVRSFPAPLSWSLSTFDVLPDGNLLAAAYAPDTRGTIHVISRTGRLVRSFGPQPPLGPIPREEADNLLGGSVDWSAAGVVYSNKSPYELAFLDLGGRTRARCTGDPRWTTPPRDVLILTPTSEGVDWPAYMHSATVFALGNGVFLNQVTNHKQRQMTLDLVDSRCTHLERRTLRDSNLVFLDRRGDRLAALEEREFPQAVIYRYRVVPRR